MSHQELATVNTGSPFDAGFAGQRGLQLVRGEGPWVYDRSGQRFFDATSMYGVTSLGHAHPALVQALGEQAGQMISCFASFDNDQRNLLLSKLAQLLDPLDQFFLCNSGTEAVEAAIKLARATTGRSGLVALSGAFHGRSLGALSATFRSKHRESFQPLLDGVRHVRPGDLEGLRRQVDSGVGLVLVETVQGEGGVRVIDPDFLQEAQALAHQAGALFAVDEVQTGIGRTGHWFGFQAAGLQPDLVCLAKGLGGGFPIGALGFRAERAQMHKGAHGSTFGGNPLACRVARAVLETIEQEGLVEQAAQHGTQLLELLRARLSPTEQGNHETSEDCVVREVRGQGLMIGVELSRPCVPIQRRMQERGFLVLGAGPRTLRLLPPLIASWSELEELGNVLCEEIEREG